MPSIETPLERVALRIEDALIACGSVRGSATVRIRIERIREELDTVVAQLAALQQQLDDCERAKGELEVVKEAAQEYVECEGRRYDTHEHQQAAIRAINKLYAALKGASHD
jgi:uncharacterized protein YydD (DUF2326 family)